MPSHSLPWLKPNAPYTPVAAAGLLFVLHADDPIATLAWVPAEDDLSDPVLILTTMLTIEAVGDCVSAAPWPDLAALDWPTKLGQAIKPMLQAGDGDPSATWRGLAGLDGSPVRLEETDAVRMARRFVAALLTDAALDANGLPSRNRLLRGVKADLSGISKPPPRVSTDALTVELRDGVRWIQGKSGFTLGFAPEAQTFGGSTGPDPSTVGVYSPLLYRLLWFGVAAMPPIGVRRGMDRVVGGPLFRQPEVMRWPIWDFPLPLRPLIALFGLSIVHEEVPDLRLLRARGVNGVFESRARKINSMVAVFGNGSRVA